MIASLPLGNKNGGIGRRIALTAVTLLFVAACSQEDSVGGSFKDDLPQVGEPQLVYDVTDIEIAVLESFPLQLLITANGHTRTGGWSDVHLVLDEDASEGIHLVYRFVGTRPTGMATQAITPVSASVSYGPWVDRAAREIEVIAETNSHTILFPSTEQE